MDAMELSGHELLSPGMDYFVSPQRHWGTEIANSTNSPEDNFGAETKAA